MKPSEAPLWKKSMLQRLDYTSITDFLYEISENGDCFGYDGGDEGYYQEYKEQFDELSAAAFSLLDALEEYDVAENWDDMTVALLGYQEMVLGYDAVETDYFAMANPYFEDLAVEEAKTRLMRLTKSELIRIFRSVMSVLVMFFDIKAAHDCLTSIVQELNERSAIFARKDEEINRLYEDLTGRNAEQFDAIVSSLPQRMWVE